MSRYVGPPVQCASCESSLTSKPDDVCYYCSVAGKEGVDLAWARRVQDGIDHAFGKRVRADSAVPDEVKRDESGRPDFESLRKVVKTVAKKTSIRRK